MRKRIYTVVSFPTENSKFKGETLIYKINCFWDPQGSMLDPLFYMLAEFINDLRNSNLIKLFLLLVV